MSERSIAGSTSAVQHTPGPWEYFDGGAQVFADNGQRHVADVRGYGALSQAMNDEAACAVMDADGRLIAAAPDLLEACKQVYKWLLADEEDPDWEPDNDGIWNENFVEAFRQMKRVIAKAEGR